MEETTTESTRVMSIELTGGNFLRRMVCILVATALQLAVSGTAVGVNQHANDCQLIEVCAAQDRQRTAKAAPPGGLIFVGATFE
jgi:tRNA U38,U39,U40 pseudouridine synthase TruA